jgi:hypothetical protein
MLEWSVFNENKELDLYEEEKCKVIEELCRVMEATVRVKIENEGRLNERGWRTSLERTILGSTENRGNNNYGSDWVFVAKS